MQAKKVARNLFREEGCSPYKLYLLPWVQVPFWIIVSFALRNLTGFFPTYIPHCAGSVESLAVEGTLWFQNLTAVDPYHILPALVAVNNLLNIQVSLIFSPSNYVKIPTPAVA